MKHNLVLFSLCCALSLATVPAAYGADLPPNVLAKNRWMELTRGDYDAALAKVPEKLRWEFATSPKRLQDLLNGMLVTKTLAAQAHAHGAKPVPVRGKGPAADADRAMAAAELQRIAADAGKSFDANRQAHEAKAREIYDLDREKFRAPEEVRLSDIAIAIKDRGDDAALARAREARARVVAGADFAAVAREYSDDATTREKGGALPFVIAQGARTLVRRRRVCADEDRRSPGADQGTGRVSRRKARRAACRADQIVRRSARVDDAGAAREIRRGATRSADPRDPCRSGAADQPASDRRAGESRRSEGVRPQGCSNVRAGRHAGVARASTRVIRGKSGVVRIESAVIGAEDEVTVRVATSLV